MSKNLVIVESPAKARTISRILGPDFTVEASYGHIRDLPESANEIPAKYKKEPWARLGVDVEHDFEPLYVVSSDKKKQIQKLKKAMVGAEALLLATDEDREGESIGWHVVEVLKPEIPVRRIAFHEITDEAIREALDKPRDIDENLVRAQESRRILDRLFGYELSPVLWKKVATGLSAGRVQSVAVRLCVERERERRAFRSAVYFDAEAKLEKDGQPWEAKLVRVGDDSLASGQDFAADTGELVERSRALWLRSAAEVEELLEAWGTEWTVTSVEEKPLKRRPAPPFTTSSMQQDANRKLRFTARHTMSVAQRLYEGIEIGGDSVGLITYMRTDSTTLAERALHDAQALIRDRYGAAYSDGPRRYKTKSRGAQEAHEAIRPTDLRRTPEAMRRHLNADQHALYELIWKRTVASQMTEARLMRTAVELSTRAAGSFPAGVFAASGTRIEFPGFLAVYAEGRESDRDRESLLPELAVGEAVEPLEVAAASHETQPPARYTEASLIQRLEKEGIGRPSTYASILDTIQRRGYVVKQGNALVPTFTAVAVTQLLESHFGEYVDLDFTARMENQLDDIAEGDLDWLEHLRAFYFGDGGSEPGLERRIATEQDSIDYPRLELGEHPETGSPIQVRVGRYGPYLQHGEGDERVSASIPLDIAPADLTIDKAVEILAHAEAGDQALGHDPDSGEPIYLKTGRYGPYVQLGETPEKGDKDAPKPKRASVPKGTAPEDVTVERALLWLSLPRTLGRHPESGEEVVATTGRFGPYIKAGSETRSIPAGDDVYTIPLERALEILAQPKPSRRRRGPTVLKELGEDGDGKGVQLLDGRYGPYLTNGDLNASLPKGEDAGALTLDRAVDLLRERGKPPKRRRSK